LAIIIVWCSKFAANFVAGFAVAIAIYRSISGSTRHFFDIVGLVTDLEIIIVWCSGFAASVLFGSNVRYTIVGLVAALAIIIVQSSRFGDSSLIVIALKKVSIVDAVAVVHLETAIAVSLYSVYRRSIISRTASRHSFVNALIFHI
jgi:hypothetical protein